MTQRWLGRVDLLVGIALSTAAVVAAGSVERRVPLVVAAAAAVGCTSSLAWRRRAPIAAAAVACVALVVYQHATRDPLGTFLPPAIVADFYLVGRRRSGLTPTDRGALAASGALGLVAAAIAAGPVLAGGKTLVEWIPLVVLPAGVGVVAGRSASVTERLAEANRQLEAQRGLVEARASAEERVRVARDLHDVVAHAVSVIVIHAGAAQAVSADDPLVSSRALALIAATGREALDDLRRLTGLLRHGDDAALASALGVAHLDDLIDQARRGGIDAELRITGCSRLEPAVDVTVYRVVQEALTNVIKHAPGAAATVEIAESGGTVTVTVTDGGARSASGGLGSGHGLLGMAERVAACGGAFQAGPRDADGFEVRARLPVRPNSRSTPGPQGAVRPAARSGFGGWSARRLDTAIAAASLVALEAEVFTSSARRGPLALNAIIVAAMALAGLWRRRAPLAFLIVVGSLALPLASGLAAPTHATVTGSYTLMVPLYTLGRWASRRDLAIGAAVWTIGATLVTVAAHAPLGGLLGALLMGAAVVTGGRMIRRQRQQTTALQLAIAGLEAQREERAQLAVMTERARIARELQGLVVTDLAGAVALAEGAAAGGPTSDNGYLRVLGDIERAGRDALGHLRHILGVLRGDGTAPLAPTTSMSEPLPA